MKVDENGLPATHDKMAHSTMVGVAPRLTVTSCESHALSSSLSNHSAIRTSIRWDAKINRTAIHKSSVSTRSHTLHQSKTQSFSGNVSNAVMHTEAKLYFQSRLKFFDKNKQLIYYQTNS